MDFDEMMDVDYLLASKIKDDLDFYELRATDIEAVRKWIVSALVVESTLHLLRGNILDVVGVRDGDPLFLFREIQTNENENTTETDTPPS